MSFRSPAHKSNATPDAATILLLYLLLALLPCLPTLASSPVPTRPAVQVVTLDAPGGMVTIERDLYGVPTIRGAQEADVLFALGYVQAQDRFFQMDWSRRLASGTLAELLGRAALDSDIELRTIGLRRAAERTLPELSHEVQAGLHAFADGVNHWLEKGAQLPPEYAVLELTRSSVPPWSALDSVTLAKLFGFAQSFDMRDLGLTEDLMAYRAAGEQFGFDGSLLFSQDLWRSQPFDPALVAPELDVNQRLGKTSRDASRRGPRIDHLDDSTFDLLQDARRRFERVPLLRNLLEPNETKRGSNWWLASGDITDTGNAMLANDPHLDLTQPGIFYEMRLRADNDGDLYDVSGIGFPGTPGVIQGCNPWLCWGSTLHPMDVADFYQERISFGIFSGFSTRFEGKREKLKLITQRYFVNLPGDGRLDNSERGGVGIFEGGVTLVVPRRNNGPIIAIDSSNILRLRGISVQYTGFSATHNLDAMRQFARARSVADFREALQLFDFGSQNWAIATNDGDIAYLTAGEMPLREDLQLLGRADGGVAPYFVRDGEHNLQHEWLELTSPQPQQAIAWQILPFSEMPQITNPAKGYIVNANNDPIGTSLDNDPLNQVRPGGGLFYLNPGYAPGMRAGRIQQLFEDRVTAGDKISLDDMAEFQANNTLRDAEVLVPYILAAFDNSQLSGVAAELVELGQDPSVAEAVERLSSWNFSAPTGIVSGYDPSDLPGQRLEPSAAEIEASVAVTLYSAWRSHILSSTLDAALERYGLEDHGPDGDRSMASLRHLLDGFADRQGVGASGIDFFVVPGVSAPEDRRDVLILRAVRDGLAMLASDEFAPAFDNSTDQQDYRWGKLHRIVFEHPLGGGFNVPPAGGLDDLAPGLQGLARSGGYGALDASSHDPRAKQLDGFMFDDGPARRFVGEMGRDRRLWQVIPGGASGIPGSPHQTDQLKLWLVNQYKLLPAARTRR
jgi:penicillin amidase